MSATAIKNHDDIGERTKALIRYDNDATAREANARTEESTYSVGSLHEREVAITSTLRHILAAPIRNSPPHLGVSESAGS